MRSVDGPEDELLKSLFDIFYVVGFYFEQMDVELCYLIDIINFVFYFIVFSIAFNLNFIIILRNLTINPVKLIPQPLLALGYQPRPKVKLLVQKCYNRVVIGKQLLPLAIQNLQI